MNSRMKASLLFQAPEPPQRDFSASLNDRERGSRLESFRIGCHRRIEHTTLVNWLARNQSMERED